MQPGPRSPLTESPSAARGAGPDFGRTEPGVAPGAAGATGDRRSASGRPAAGLVPHKRLDGLDVVRAVAILMVLFGHGSEHASPPAWFKFVFAPLGSVGVELFFVLSGFLIGGIIIQALDRGQFSRFKDVGRFWARRWMRTLPLYYVFLLVWLRLDWRGPFSPLDHLEYFVFAQNLFTPTPPFFELSWSLAVEEWFYLLFPLPLLALVATLPARRAFIVTTLLFILVPLAARLSVALGPAPTDLFGAIRLPVAFRFDAIMYGVIVAAIRSWQPDIFRQMVRLFPLALALFAGLLFYYWVWIHQSEPTVARVALLFLVTPLVSALLLPGMSRLSLDRHKVAQFFFRWTSTLSYSMYLGHIIVIILVNRFLMQHGLGFIHDTWWLAYPLFGVLFYALAFVTYSLIERPFLSLRDRLVP